MGSLRAALRKAMPVRAGTFAAGAKTRTNGSEPLMSRSHSAKIKRIAMNSVKAGGSMAATGRARAIRFAILAFCFLALCAQGAIVAGAMFLPLAALGTTAAWHLSRAVSDELTSPPLPWILLAAAFCALSVIVGMRYTVLADVHLEAVHYALSPIVFAGDTAMGYIALLWVRKKLLSTRLGSHDPGKHSWAIASLAIFACWLPFLIIFYPGSVPYDGYLQIDMYFGVKDLTDHHPVLTTLAIGLLISAGQSMFGDVNVGIFLCVLAQSAISSAIYGYVSRFAGNLTGSRAGWCITVAFFAANPIWGAWSQVLGKDTVYYAMMALFTVRTAMIVLDGRSAGGRKWRSWAIWVLVAIALACLRKEGCIVSVVSGLSIAVALRGSKAGAIASLSVVIAASLLVYGVVTPRVIDKADWQRYDGYSIAFQQIARVVSAHESDLSEKEKRVIDEVMRLDDLAGRYDPQNADPVKDSVRAMEGERFTGLMHVWAELGLKYPATYLSAFLNHSYCFYYPAGTCEKFGPSKFYIMGEPLDTGALDIHYADGSFWKAARSLTANTVDGLALSPLSSFLFSSGAYTWVIISCLALVLQSRKRRLALAFTPAILVICICCVSPVNGYLRYSLPYIAATPPLVASCFYAYAAKVSDPAAPVRDRRSSRPAPASSSTSTRRTTF